MPPISSQMGGLCQYTHTRPSASPIDGDHCDGPVLSGRCARITAMVLQWREKRVASKRDLQSLIGTLSHAATAVPPGRTFLRRMIKTMKIPKRQRHHVCLNMEFQSDIQWWACFLPQWNGRSILPHARATHSFKSDASGSWGCGAVSDSACWFQVEWPQSWHLCHIAAKEMVPVVIAIAVWGQNWQASMVQVFSDNMSVVCALTTGVARDPLLMHLLRCLHFFTAHFQKIIEAHHIAGVDNNAADALSRNKLDVFLSCSPQAAPSPSPIPQSLLDMLLHNKPDWTSPSWRKCFSVPWEGSSTIHTPLLWYWPTPLHRFLPGRKLPTAAIIRAHPLHICGSFGK